MRRSAMLVLAAAVGLGAAPPLRAQLYGRDPLTRGEANAMRNAAGNPGKRVDLLLKFAGQRLSRLQSLQASYLPGRRSTMHLMLRQYREILNELDDNFDTWMSGRRTSEMGGPPKLKKPLHKAIKAERGFLVTLAAVRKHSTPADLRTYRFALSDAQDATRSHIKDAQDDWAEIQHRKAEQKAAKKKHKHFPFFAAVSPSPRLMRLHA